MYKGMPVIALEEHYFDKELAANPGFGAPPPIAKLLYDLEGERIEAMDRAGIDVQVLSHNAPSGQGVGADGGDLIRRVNDRLAEVCAKHPKRFYGFAALATADPDGAARELERCVKDLGFVGAMLHGPTGTQFPDDKSCWGIFERAQALDVPIYIHPSFPMKAVVDAYYADYAKAFPSILNAGWGFTVETATAVIRLILSGMFAKYPKTKIIVGHFGEGLPFLLWRIDQALSRPGQEGIKFRDVFCNNFWLTCSGNFSTPALLCCMQELGMDRLMFSLDYPYVTNEDGMDWVKTLQINEADLRKFMYGNAAQLLKLPVTGA
jgi:2,3-dihydroxybenzoate decarboxylase